MAALSAGLSSSINGFTAAILSPEFTLDTFDAGFTIPGLDVELGVAGVTGVFGDGTKVSDSDDFRRTFFLFAVGPWLLIDMR